MKPSNYADLPAAWGDVPNSLRPDPWAARVRTLKLLAALFAVGAGLCLLALLLGR